MSSVIKNTDGSKEIFVQKNQNNVSGRCIDFPVALLKIKKEKKRKRLWTREWLAWRRSESVLILLMLAIITGSLVLLLALAIPFPLSVLL